MIRMNIDSRAKGRLVDAVTACRQRQPADAFPADEAPHMNRRTAVRCALATMLLWCSAAIHAEQHTVPLFVMSSPGSETQGVLRLVSKVETASTVAIHAIDDAGGRSGPATLTLNALAAVDLSATELQSGNAAKGLLAGLGDIVGDMRLVIDSDMPIVSSAYVRGADGTLSAMNATAIQAMAPQPAGYRYDVAVFHPASHATQPSRLRLSNPNDTEAQVAIDARDDTGAAASGGTVRLTMPPGGARSLTSQQLEAGDAAVISGRLGAGVGNWRLSVSADSPIQVMNVAVGAVTAYWSNLSTTAVAGWAPQDAASFEARFLDRRIVSRDGQDRFELQIQPGNRLRDVGIEDGVEAIEEGGYRYERTGRDAGRLSIDNDSGDRCEASLYFASPTSGWYASVCIDGIDRVETSTGGPWLTLDAAAAALDLGPGPDDRTYTAGTAIDPLTLPAASGGDGEFTYSLSPEVPGLRFDPATRELAGTPTEADEYLMTYRVRDASGDSDWRYFNIAVVAATGGGQETTYGIGDTLSDLPTGSWSPDVTSPGASFSSSGGDTTVQFDEGGYIEEGGFRYTCQSSGGCVIENRSVTSGTVVQTAMGTAPGAGSGDHGDDRATATGVEAGSDTDGTLESGDVDYFRIVLDAPGTLEIYSSGRTDTYGYLEDAAGETLRSNDDGGAGTNFRISEDVSAGTYYVRVRGYSSRTTGEYTLSVRFTESDSQPSFAAGSGPGDQSYTVGTAISALTLPEAGGGDGPLTYSLSPEVPGLTFNATTRRLTGMPTAAGTYDMTYRVRDTDGDSDSLTFTIMVESAGGGGQGTTYAVGDTLSDLPTGTWSASVRGGGALLISGDGVTVRLNDEAYFEHGGHRYTCQSTGGCVIENRSVTSGTVVQTASGTAPGDSGTGTDAQPSFATGSNPGDQSYTVGTAIDALTLPEASGGEGPLTYSLSPEVPGLMFDATATVRRLSGTPSVAGTYNMTYRARDVDGDTDSLTFTISVDDVADNGPAGSFDLHEDNWSARGITYANGRFHVVDSRGDKVYAYTEEGTRDATADIELHEDNSDPWGIAYANGRFYVVDWRDNKVYAYTETGGRDASAEFNLHEDNSNARGITHANGRFYVVDWSDVKVYAYAQTGTRDVTVEFDLHDDNWTAGGIAHANDRFYVVNLNDDKVYAYAETGGHDVSAEFDLRDENSTPHGIAHANGRFYIVDWTDRELYVYSVSDQRALVEFNLYDDNSDPYGIAHSNGRFYVLDRFDDKVYAYTETGARDAAADFDLHGDNSYPEKIAYANGRFYVLDGIDDKVYAYNETGTRVASADFDLHDDNSDPHGIAYANGRFYVVDRSGDKVYAYSETGRRDTSADLHLGDGNSYPKGIAYANDRFYALDRYKVYAYWRYSGQRGMSADFLLHDDHHVPEGIAYDNGRFYIVDYVNDRVYSYPETVDPDGPDLMAAPTSVSASELSAGASYTLSAIVRNRGNQPSAAATLRYYRSADPIISASDTEIGTDTVAGLSAGAISTESINLTAPIGNDCYYCGACVEAADGESITSNNCSNSVLIAVGEQADIAVSRTVLNAPSSGTVGVSRISMTVDVTNRGQVASPPSKLIFSGGRSISVDIPVLAPGETMTLSRDVGTVQIGTSTYRACIDFPCDPDSQNNCRSRSVTYL